VKPSLSPRKPLSTGRVTPKPEKQTPAKPEQPAQKVMNLGDPASREGKLKMLGGSLSDDFNNVLANDAVKALWTKNSDSAFTDRQIAAVAGALVGIGPQDELEGMLAGQMIAAHSAAMECYRRAMIGEQTFEGRKENLAQANKLSRTYTTLLEALNRHRGKGQQKVTVEHVHVHQGGQAIVGAVTAEGGGGVLHGNQRQPHAKAISHAPVAPLWSEDPEQEPLPVAGDAEWTMPHARR
jgi:glutamate mutase epsilon subunit